VGWLGLDDVDVPVVFQPLAQITRVGLDRPHAQALSGLELKEALDGFFEQQARRSTVHAKVSFCQVLLKPQTAGLPFFDGLAV